MLWIKNKNLITSSLFEKWTIWQLHLSACSKILFDPYTDLSTYYQVDTNFEELIV